jgi:hypothetical protein
VLDVSGGVVNLVMEMEAWNTTQCNAFVCVCVCVCVFVKLGENATTIHGKLQQAFRDDAVSTAQDFHWHKMFSEGRTLIEESSAADNHQQHGEVTTLRVRELVQSNQRLTDCL